MIEQVTDYEARALARLAQQFRGKTGLEALVAAQANQAQGIEDAVFGLILLRSVFNATGANLDRIGKLVGAARPISGAAASDDGAYRGLVLGRIVVNRTQGETENVIALLKLLGATQVHLQELYPAAVIVQVRGTPVVDGATLRDLTEQATAPVRLDVIVSYQEGYFGFDGDADAFGFDDLTGAADAGTFAEIV